MTLVALGALFIVGAGVAVAWFFVGASLVDRRLPSCAELPTLKAAQESIEAHPEMVSRLRDLPDTRNSVWLSAYSPEECPGKGAINIAYDNVGTRQEIKDLLGNTFFGIPYTFSNV